MQQTVELTSYIQATKDTRTPSTSRNLRSSNILDSVSLRRASSTHLSRLARALDIFDTRDVLVHRQVKRVVPTIFIPPSAGHRSGSRYLHPESLGAAFWDTMRICL